MAILQNEITNLVENCQNTALKDVYMKRLREGNLCREENAASHFCAYFVPFNQENNTVLIGDHKKSGLWLLPGGHIEPNEPLLNTVNREIEEELGVKDFFPVLPTPFLFTTTDIISDVRPCKKHFDIWFLVPTNGANFVIDYSEYHEVRWVTLPEAKRLTTDPANLKALTTLESRYT